MEAWREGTHAFYPPVGLPVRESVEQETQQQPQNSLTQWVRRARARLGGGVADEGGVGGCEVEGGARPISRIQFLEKIGRENPTPPREVAALEIFERTPAPSRAARARKSTHTGVVRRAGTHREVVRRRCLSGSFVGIERLGPARGAASPRPGTVSVALGRGPRRRVWANSQAASIERRPESSYGRQSGGEKTTRPDCLPIRFGPIFRVFRNRRISKSYGWDRPPGRTEGIRKMGLFPRK